MYVESDWDYEAIGLQVNTKFAQCLPSFDDPQT